METWHVPIYHTSDGSASGLPCAGLCSGSNAELSRNRCSACGKPRHEVMLGHNSFANSTDDQRNFVGVSLSLDSAWLLVERQHTISPHLLSGKVISALSVCLFQRCFLLHLTSCILFCTDYDGMYPTTHSVCHAALQGAFPPGWAQNNVENQPVSISHVSMVPSGSHMLMFFSSPPLVLRVTPLWIWHSCSHWI